jgi:hypothetical protein
MFKIEIREQDGKLFKKKFYESAEQFNRWLPKHRHYYWGSYTVTGFKREGEEWVKCEQA